MKVNIILLLLMLPALLPAQFDFTGTWEGVLTQDEGGYASEYVFKLYLKQDGLKVSGRSFVKVGEIYAEMELKGRLIGDKVVHLEETEVLKHWKYDGMEWCYKKLDLFIVADEKLEGPWTGHTGQSACIPGKILLRRTSPRA